MHAWIGALSQFFFWPSYVKECVVGIQIWQSRAIVPLQIAPRSFLLLWFQLYTYFLTFKYNSKN